MTTTQGSSSDARLVSLFLFSYALLFQARHRVLHGLKNLVYMRDDRLREGLYPQQEEPVRRFLRNARTVLVAGAGAGKELLALYKKGFVVDGFDCSQYMVDYGNEFLRREGCPYRIELSSPNEFPESPKQYDAVIVGAGVYINILPRAERMQFLTTLRSKLKPGGVVLLGFCSREEGSAYFRLIYRVGGFLRMMLRHEPIELGDKLEPCFEHHFSAEEIEAEAESAGFKVLYTNTDESYLAQMVAAAHESQ